MELPKLKKRIEVIIKARGEARDGWIKELHEDIEEYGDESWSAGHQAAHEEGEIEDLTDEVRAFLRALDFGWIEEAAERSEAMRDLINKEDGGTSVLPAFGRMAG